MKVAVAGCGIGGLCVAHALTQLGHTVVLLEKSHQLKPVGAGISVQPNAMQALERLGLAKAVSDAGWQAPRAQVLSSNGKTLNHFDFGNHKDKLGFLPHTIFRGDLIRVLHEKLDPSRASIWFDEHVKSFQETESGVIIQTDRTEIECDALIGADGIHSKVRQQIQGEQDLNFAGYTCWRGMVDDPDLVAQVETMTEIWGKGARFGFMRCNAKQVYWFATENRRTRTDHLPGDNDWPAKFESWVAPVSRLIAATPACQIVHNDIVDISPSFPWGRGRVTLLGDAAHAMTPNFGQGGAQAIEDAVVLGMAMVKWKNAPSAFRKYESFRYPRTKSLQKGSKRFGIIGQGGNWMFRMVRNHVLTRLPKSFVDRQLFSQCDFNSHISNFSS